MKYPKLRNGPSPVGEALARHMNRLRAPWLTTIAGDVVANKMGARSEVFQGAPDAIYSLGYERAAAPNDFSVRGTRSFFAPFVRVGSWYRGRFDTPAFAPIGEGRGVVPVAVSPGVAALYVSRYARTFRELVQFAYSEDPYSAYAWSLYTLGRSLHADHQNAFGVLGYVMYDVGGTFDSFGAWVFTKDNGETFDQTGFSYGPGWRHGAPSANRLDASTLLVTTPTYVTKDAAGFNDNFDPTLSFAVTIRGDGEWSVTDVGALLDFSYPSPAVLASFMRESTNRMIWDDLAGLRGVRLSNGGSLFVANAYGYDRVFDPSGFETPNPALSANLAIFTSAGTGAYARTGTLTLPNAFTVGRMLVVGDKPVIFLPPDLTLNPAGRSHLVVFTPTGMVEAVRELPFSPHLVSANLFALDESTIAVPAYGARQGVEGYRVFRSTDYGETWTPFTTISRSADPPPLGDNFLQNYGDVAWLRDGGRPASLSPGAPWQTDDRLPKPWSA